MIMIIDQSGTVLKLRTGMMTEILPGNTIATSSVACQAALLAGHANVGLDHVSLGNVGPVNVGLASNAGLVKIVGLVLVLLTNAGLAANKNSPIAI